MKYIFINLSIFTLILSGFTACKISDKNEQGITVDDIDKYTTIAFDSETIDFGEVEVGNRLSVVYKFRNTGNHPLFLQSVKASCGCTMPKSWPKGMIAPGEGGEIPVEFDPKRGGKVDKVISVIANTRPSLIKLHITGTILSPK